MHKLSKTLVFCISILLLLFLVPQGNSFAAGESYVSPEGITIQTDSPAWKSQSQLQALYLEIKNNAHGDEFKLLKEIYVHDSFVKGPNIAGEYEFRYSTDIFGHTKMQPGTIHLYGGDKRKTVASMARTLSHEYGHHVTHFYTLQQDGFVLTDKNRWSDTTYTRLRGLKGVKEVGIEGVAHEWNLAEIAADDYVQLFGSSLAKSVTPVDSRIEQIEKAGHTAPFSWDASMYNIVPQENMMLPLAAQVPGLYEWLAPHLHEPAQRSTIPTVPELKIKDVIHHGNVGYEVRFTWTGDNNPNSTYTLVTFKDGETLPEPIVTREGNEPFLVSYGNFSTVQNGRVYTFKDPNTQGVHHFRLFAQNHEGVTVSSEMLSLDMNNPDHVTTTDLMMHQSTMPAVVDSVEKHFSLDKLQPANAILEILNKWLQQIADILYVIWVTVHRFFQ